MLHLQKDNKDHIMLRINQVRRQANEDRAAEYSRCTQTIKEIGKIQERKLKELREECRTTGIGHVFEGCYCKWCDIADFEVHGEWP